MSPSADPSASVLPIASSPGKVTVDNDCVHIPDMFSSIMAVKPLVNPKYHEIKPKAESWIKKIYHEDDKWASRISSADYTYMAGMWAPSCQGETLQLVVDYCHWIFAFDDQFDEGHLRNDPIAAQQEINMTYSIMENTESPVVLEHNAIRYVFQTIWDRLQKTSSLDLQQQFKDMHRRFFDSLLEQVSVNCSRRALTRDVEEFMNMRRANSGVFPIIILASYSLGAHVTEEIFNHPSLQECMRISAEIVVLHNDILSYRKDVDLDVDHNLLKLLIAQGLSPQKAVDKISTMLDDCYAQWYTALAQLPAWGEKVDREVLKFVDSCRNVALGCLHWSFKTTRYLGTEAIQVRETRMLKLGNRTLKYLEITNNLE